MVAAWITDELIEKVKQDLQGGFRRQEIADRNSLRLWQVDVLRQKISPPASIEAQDIPSNNGRLADKKYVSQYQKFCEGIDAESLKKKNLALKALLELESKEKEVKSQLAMMKKPS